jgi:hypothetical protein
VVKRRGKPSSARPQSQSAGTRAACIHSFKNLPALVTKYCNDQAEPLTRAVRKRCSHGLCTKGLCSKCLKAKSTGQGIVSVSTRTMAVAAPCCTPTQHNIQTCQFECRQPMRLGQLQLRVVICDENNRLRLSRRCSSCCSLLLPSRCRGRSCSTCPISAAAAAAAGCCCLCYRCSCSCQQLCPEEEGHLDNGQVAALPAIASKGRATRASHCSLPAQPRTEQTTSAQGLRMHDDA